MKHTATITVALVGLASGAAAAPQPLDQLPPRKRERVHCSIVAALEYQIPANVMLAISEREGGQPGVAVEHGNGAVDVGPLQFNTRYLQHLQDEYGIDPRQATGKGCYPYRIAAARVRNHLQRDAGDVWTRAANYHSRTPKHNAKYRGHLVRLGQKWERWLRDNFETERVVGLPNNGAPPRASTHPPSATKRPTASHRPRRRPKNPDSPGVQATLALLGGWDSAGAGEGPAWDAGGVQRTLGLLGTYERIAPPESHSVGRPHAGHLQHGVQLPEHSAYRVQSLDRAWGTASAVGWLVDAFDRMQAAPPIAIHDLSAEQGGRLSGHRSHQSGRDADLAYYRRECAGVCGFEATTPAELDAARQWHLLRQWLTRGQLEFAFVDYGLQEPLFKAAKAAGATPRQLARWFQFPHGPEHPGGTIRHVDNHSDHVHVRFRCTKEDTNCEATRTRLVKPEGVSRGGPPLLQLVEEEGESSLERTLRLLQ